MILTALSDVFEVGKRRNRAGIVSGIGLQHGPRT
jgi:hypothetical protein